MVWSSASKREDHPDGGELHSKFKRRGLSKHYNTKSQSFSSLELALQTDFGESALGLSKRSSSTLFELCPEMESEEAPTCSPRQSSAISSRISSFDGEMTSMWSPSPCVGDDMCEEFISALTLSSSSPLNPVAVEPTAHHSRAEHHLHHRSSHARHAVHPKSAISGAVMLASS